MFPFSIIDLSKCPARGSITTGLKSGVAVIQGGLPMLVLSRRTGESVRVGTDITFTVLSVQGTRVRIGINAPAQLQVLRDELRSSTPTECIGHEHERPETCACT